MIAFLLVDLLLVNSILASDDAYLSNGWIPVPRSFVFNQMSNSITRTRHTSDWKPSQRIDDSNIDEVKKDAIRIISPDQVQTMTKENNVNAWPSPTEAAAVFKQQGYSEQNDATEFNQNQDHELLKSEPRDKLQEGNVKTNINRQSKKLWDPSSTEDLIFNALTTKEPSIKAGYTEISINVKNKTTNNYEVTEPSNVQEWGQETNDLRNTYNNKFMYLLSKYNIKDDDNLSNYARSKVRRKLLYPTNVSPITLIPFRFNSLNHLPVDPSLAVLLSNYGYYLHGFYGLQNNYKNLYGFSASNNIHNNKPFGSYKIYSDTDSSN